MQTKLLAAVALAAVALSPVAAFASAEEDRVAGIELCRAEIATRASAEASAVRLEEVKPRARTLRATFSIRKDGPDSKADCLVDLRGKTVTELSLAADGRTWAQVLPAAATASAAPVASATP